MSGASAQVGPVELATTADRLRFEVLRMIARARSCHVGSCLSVMDILVALYGGALRRGTEREERDRVILSKGHAAAALYAVLAEYGHFPAERLEDYLKDGSPFIAHTNTFGIPGVEFSTGSLGHGLSVANGIALAGRVRGRAHRVFTILSEGDCQEGSTWEAAMFAGHHRLSSMICIVDHNKIQNFGRVDEVLGLAPLDAKFEAAGWATRNIDGHDLAALVEALSAAPFEPGRPTALIAHTIKGKGVSFMEDQLKWHYQTPSADDLSAARLELLP
ncbi:transketolase [Chelatococcus sp. GCM10030263]|uniref:transketolase n=1 Tax=Chelatococcus sp. GCM10030263 TaxID=3273387 RepID=UPI0036220281